MNGIEPHFIPDQAQSLTPREQEVLVLIGEALSTKEIAFQLGISFKTAACHRTHIMEKLSARNCVALVRAAIRRGLIPA